jgi:hypothetical protein
LIATKAAKACLGKGPKSIQLVTFPLRQDLHIVPHRFAGKKQFQELIPNSNINLGLHVDKPNSFWQAATKYTGGKGRQSEYLNLNPTTARTAISNYTLEDPIA